MLTRLIRDLFRPPSRAHGAPVDPGAAVLERAVKALYSAPEEAERLCREVLRDLPEHVEARVTLGAAQLERGEPAVAVETLRGALRAAPRHGEGQLLLGRALRAVGDVDAAVLALQRAQRLIPERSDLWNEFGLLQLELGNLDSAWVNFDRAATLNAHQAQAWINLAVVAQRQGLYAKALACLERAVQAEPDSGLAWSNYGLALRDNDRLEEAIPALRRAAELRSAHAATRVNLAAVLLDDEQYAEARAQAEHALALKPDSPEAHVLVASLYARTGDFERAAESYERALLVSPDSAVARAGLGELQLLERDFARGWDNYEHRFGLPDAAAPKLPFPRWDGAGLAQGRLLVRSEQGIGDMILFASCVPDALQRVHGLVLEAPEKLVPLFARSFARAEVRPATPGYPSWLREFGDLGAAIPAGSLMGLFRRSAADFPARKAYLYADPARVDRWRERLAELGPGPKLGLTWGGGFYRTGRKGRSIGPDDLEPLLAHSEAHFVSLQYTSEAAAEAAELGAHRGRPVHHWPEAIADYEETAALVSALDMVITVCTAAAHLSGALGQRVWILAPESASWRYLGSGEDLPWYPSARVFRRAPGGTWRAVVERVADALGTDLGLAARAAGRDGRGPEREAGADHGPTRVVGSGIAQAPPTPAVAASREDALLGRARELWAGGAREAAIESLESSLAAEPAWADGWHELGKLYAALNRLGEARDCLELALHHDPRHLGSLELFAKLSESATAYALAAGYLARACEVAPQRPDFRVRLGKAQYLLGAFGEAQESARRAIALDPSSSDAHIVLGLAQIGLEDYPAAVEALETAVRFAPRVVSGHLNLGNAYLYAGRFAEAKERLRWVITHEPNNFIARWDYAHLKLASREFEEGWAHYEFRKQAINVAGKTLSLPEWRGQPLDDGTALVILREQGLGDEIMFTSCMPDVLRRVRHCVLQCDARLTKLFGRSFPGVRTVVGDAVRTALGQTPGFEVSAGTLPVLFRRSEREFPAHSGFLRPDEDRVIHWRQRLTALGPGLKVGVSWRGGSAHTRTKLRSIPLADLAPVLRVPGCRFVSLQYGAVDEDIATLAGEPGLGLAHFPEVIADYDETAALVSALDLVVTVCTSLVHLTGALGRPVWVLVPSVPEWRYCFDGETLPWYPSARLIRQRPGEPWARPVAEAARRLGALTGVVPR
jgi:tetratricopeptide (TPR) repeat protein